MYFSHQQCFGINNLNTKYKYNEDNIGNNHSNMLLCLYELDFINNSPIKLTLVKDNYVSQYNDVVI